jgi:hypothetical protein
VQATTALRFQQCRRLAVPPRSREEVHWHKQLAERGSSMPMRYAGKLHAAPPTTTPCIARACEWGVAS